MPPTQPSNLSQNSTALSVWQLKPWWCQPWSILLTGAVLILGSWFLVHKIWLTALVAVPVLSWQGFFLLLYPRLMKHEAAIDQQSGN